MITGPSSKLVTAIAVVVGSIALVVGVAIAGVETVVLTPGVAAPGSTVVVSGTSTDCDPGSTVNFFFTGPPFAVLGSTTTDPVTGDYSGTLTIPAETPVGPNRIGAQCVGGSATMYVDFTVQAPTTTSTTSTSTTTVAPAVTTTSAPVEPSAPTRPAEIEPSGTAKPQALALAG